MIMVITDCSATLIRVISDILGMVAPAQLETTSEPKTSKLRRGARVQISATVALGTIFLVYFLFKRMSHDHFY